MAIFNVDKLLLNKIFNYFKVSINRNLYIGVIKYDLQLK